MSNYKDVIQEKARQEVIRNYGSKLKHGKGVERNNEKSGSKKKFMTKAIETISFKLYRGELDPVTEVRKSEINLYADHLEYVYDYNFTDSGKDELRATSIIIPRHQLSLNYTVWYNEDDANKINYPRIELFVNGSYLEYIYIRKFKEAEEIYNKLKSWMLNG